MPCRRTGINSLFLRTVKGAHYLWPVLGNQPSLNEALNALDWENTPVAAATSETARGRIETRTIRVLPAPQDIGFQDAKQALLIERYVTYKKNGQWRTRAESVLYLTSLAADQTTPEDLLAHVRGHWQVERTHWLRDVVLGEDASRIAAAHRAMAAVRNAVTGILHLHQVPTIAAQLRACHRDPYQLPLLLLGLMTPLGPNGNPAVT